MSNAAKNLDITTSNWFERST